MRIGWIITLFCYNILMCLTGYGETDQGVDLVRSHGLHPFGNRYLKFRDETGQYACINPNAPKGGELRMGWSVSYNKKNPFAVGGAEVPGYWLAFEPMADMSYDDDDVLSVYGRLAEWFEIAPDNLSITIKVRDNARFSDGMPVTADDVIFSWNITGDPGYSPATRLTLQDVDRLEKIDNLTVKVYFKKASRDLPFNFASGFYILPQHIYGRPGTDFSKDFNEMNPVGSGPYVIEKDDPSAYVTWKKNPDYWGKDLWITKGRYNFDRITFKIYTDKMVMREAFRAELIDLMDISSAQEWVLDYVPEKMMAIRNNWIVKMPFENSRTPSVQAFVFNQRRTIFQDIRVRRAIASLFDFDILSKNLFFDSYTRQNRIFEDDRFRAAGPAEGRAWDVLNELRKKYNQPDSGLVYVPKEALTVGPRHFNCDLSGHPIPKADRLLLAGAALDDAGWKFDPVKKVRMKDGVPLQFEVLLVGTDGSFGRVLNDFFDSLAKIGVVTADKGAQLPEYQERVDKYDYDMIVRRFYILTCPGVEQMSFWHSSAVDRRAAENWCGVKNPAVDEVIGKMMSSQTPEDVYFYVTILDRLLCANAYIIPQWYSPEWRTVYWNRLGHTDKSYGRAASFWNAHNFWWLDSERDAALTKAKREKMALPPVKKPGLSQ